MTTENNKSNSIFERNIQQGVEKGYISISEDNSKITYYYSREYTAGFKNPEEKEVLEKAKERIERIILDNEEI